MKYPSTHELVSLGWQEHPDNPLIKPAFIPRLIADPTFLPPSLTSDGRWHMFAHSVWGIHHFLSSDGVAWERLPKYVSLASLRPFLFIHKQKYLLFYERVLTLVPQIHSRIECRQSPDLYTWSRPVVVFSPSLSWHQEGNSRGNAGNPCVIETSEGYRLYYSAGLVYLRDCLFSEPKYIGVAIAHDPMGEYISNPDPILGPDGGDPCGNLAAGSIKVLRTEDGFVGFQNGIYWSESISHSGSAIRMLVSSNGYSWQRAHPRPILIPEHGWKRSHVYAMDVRLVNDSWCLFFNARDGWLFGKECIGCAISVNN